MFFRSDSLAPVFYKSSKGKYDRNQELEIGNLLLSNSCHATIAAIKIQIS